MARRTRRFYSWPLDDWSLRRQIFVLAAATILILGAAIGIAVNYEARRQFETNLGQNLSELAFHLVDKFDRGMWSREAELDVLLALNALRAPSDIDETRRVLEGLKKAVPLFSWVGLIDPAGIVRAATGGVLEGDDLSQRPVYLNALKGRFIGDVHEALLLASKLPNESGEPMRFVDISVPIHGPDGALTGILASHLSWTWAREIETSLIGAETGRSGVELFILDSKGQVLLSPRGEGRFETLALDALDLAKRDKRGWTIERWPDGKSYLTGYAFEIGYQSYPGLGWTALARQPLDVAFQPAQRFQTLILQIGLVCALLGALAWWFVANRIAGPIARLTVGAEGLTSGERESLPEVAGSMEVSRLSRSLRALVASLTSEESRADRMEALAHQDRLTGLPNRLALDTLLDHLLPRAKRTGEVVACLYLDLDGFKPVNDTLGHKAGDAVLREIAGRLKQSLRGGDAVLRLGGDEFLAIVTAHAERWHDEAELCASRIIAAIHEPIAVGDGHTVTLGISIGIAGWPVANADFHHVVGLADQALYAAKRAGKNRATFHDAKLAAE
jgi:diguanylate cyclase (GGDEF)-like protein